MLSLSRKIRLSRRLIAYDRNKRAMGVNGLVIPAEFHTKLKASEAVFGSYIQSELRSFKRAWI